MTKFYVLIFRGGLYGLIQVFPLRRNVHKLFPQRPRRGYALLFPVGRHVVCFYLCTARLFTESCPKQCLDNRSIGVTSFPIINPRPSNPEKSAAIATGLSARKNRELPNRPAFAQNALALFHLRLQRYQNLAKLTRPKARRESVSNHRSSHNRRVRNARPLCALSPLRL